MGKGSACWYPYLYQVSGLCGNAIKEREQEQNSKMSRNEEQPEEISTYLGYFGKSFLDSKWHNLRNQTTKKL